MFNDDFSSVAYSNNVLFSIITEIKKIFEIIFTISSHKKNKLSLNVPKKQKFDKKRCESENHNKEVKIIILFEVFGLNPLKWAVCTWNILEELNYMLVPNVILI